MVEALRPVLVSVTFTRRSDIASCNPQKWAGLGLVQELAKRPLMVLNKGRDP